MFVFIMIMNKVNPSKLSLIEVFRTKSGTIHQSDGEECWYIDFGGKTAKFNYYFLKRLKKAVENVNVEQMLMDPAKGSDLAIISLHACDHCYVLSAIEVLAFKELIHGTFVMFELNHLVKDRLLRVI